jgi:hypothetical protein
MTVTSARKKRPFIHRLFVLLLIPILIATDLLGTVPNSAFSSEVRRYVALMLPAEFVDWLNPQLAGVRLPTLPPAPDDSASPEQEVTPTLEWTSTPTLTPTLTLTFTLTFTPTFTPTPTITPTPTFVPNPAGQWLFSWQYTPQFDTIWVDTIQIVQRGDGFVLTSVTDNYLGPVTIISQNWDGNSLDFIYRNPGLDTTVHMQTIGVDADGQLWVNVLSEWMGPPITSLPPVP